MTDYDGKYSGEQIDALLDMVAASVGGVIVSQDTYITPFTAKDVATITSNETGTIFIPLALIEAILTKKRVLIPSQTIYSGYVVVIQADGYIDEGGGSAKNAGVWLTFIHRGILYNISQDDAVVSGGISASRENVTARQL